MCEWMGERAMGGWEDRTRGRKRGNKKREEKRREERREGNTYRTSSNAKRTLENNRPPSAKVFFWCVDSSEKSRGGFDRFTAERANVVAGGGEGGERGRRRGGGERKGQGKVAPTKVRQLHNAQRACDKTISR